MTRARSILLLSLWFALVAAPVAFAFHEALQGSPRGLRLLLAGLALALVMLAGPMLRQGLRSLGPAGVWLVGATLAFGLGLTAITEPKVQTADSAEVGYSDGRREAGVTLAPIAAWGREVPAYPMHPAYDAAVVADSLVATFSTRPGKVGLLFAKPRDVLFQPDGSRNDSDGISVHVRAYDAQGRLGHSGTFHLPQSEFLQGRWIERTVSSASGIASVRVSLDGGPPGSTASFDSTFVGFEIPAWQARAEGIARVVLLCIGFAVVALLLLLNLPPWLADARRRRAGGVLPALLQGGVVLAVVLLLAYWSQSRTSYVYFWDYRNYWEKTETLHALLAGGDWRQAVALFASTYTANYSLLPAVWPALLGLVSGGVTRIGYALAITAVYAAPAYLMVACLGRRLLDGGSAAAAPAQQGRVLSALPVVFGVPVFFGTTLYLMPDIGGVVLVVAALLSASTLVDAIGEPTGGAARWPVSKALFRSSISLGVLLGLMFVFRRWYAFSAVGIVCGVSVLVLLAAVRARGARREVLCRAFASAVLVAFAAMPLLCWFLFAWSGDPGQHDYAQLYSSYRVTLTQDARVFGELFGVVAPVLCVVGAAWVYHVGKDRRLFFLVTFSTLLAVLLFLGVQSPGRHHYFLLMPLMGALLAGLSLLLARRFGVIGIAGFTLVLVAGGLLATRSPEESPRVGLFAGFEDIRPRQQQNAQGLGELSRWLALPENRDSRFCLVASSVAINQGMFRELWQILPNVEKNAYGQRMVRLGQVDSIDGPPMPGVLECGIFLVGVPFQFHLQRDQQYSLEILQQELVDGTGIGMAVARDPQVFPMGEGVEIRAYRTTRQITRQEYEALVQRFLAHKATPAPHAPAAAGDPPGGR